LDGLREPARQKKLSITVTELHRICGYRYDEDADPSIAFGPSSYRLRRDDCHTTNAPRNLTQEETRKHH
jgi:hypothetical protein